MPRPTAFGPITWAKRVPTMRRADGRPDTTAHHVLLALATYAHRDGSDARPSVATLAEDTRISAEYVADALDRIQAAGLISKTACFNGGTVVWQLHLEVVDSGPSVHEERVAQRRKAERERQRRRREKKAREAACHGVADRDVTVSEPVTNTPSVTVHEPVTSRREQRDVTGVDTVTHGPTSVTTAGHTGYIPHELPIELPEELSPSPAAPDDFDRFWAVYPLKKSKKGAIRKWALALKQATAEEIIAGAERYAKERQGTDPQYTKHPTTWLHNGCWSDEPQQRHLRAVSGGYQPFQSPTDQSVYDEDLF